MGEGGGVNIVQNGEEILVDLEVEKSVEKRLSTCRKRASRVS